MSPTSSSCGDECSRRHAERRAPLRGRRRPHDRPPRRPRRRRCGGRHLDVDRPPVPGPARRGGRAVARHGGADRRPGPRSRRRARRRRCRTGTRPGARLMWANARDTALGFYAAHGFEAVGDGFVTTDTCLPHHRVLRHL